MKIEKLKDNMVFVNYRELCSYLEMPEKGGKGKEYQLKELERYALVFKGKRSFMIKKVYDEPLPKEDNRKNNGREKSEATIIIEKLFLASLLDRRGNIFSTPTAILEEFLMVNDNFTKGLNDKNLVTKTIDVNLDSVERFYNINVSLLKNSLDRALNNLAKSALLTYCKDYAVIENDGYFRPATDREKQIILDTMREIMTELGISNLGQAFSRELISTFYMRCTLRVRELTDNKVHRFMQSYNIVYSVSENTITENRLTHEKQKELKLRLNQLVCENIISNADNRYEKASNVISNDVCNTEGFLELSPTIISNGSTKMLLDMNALTLLLIDVNSNGKL